MANNSSFSEHWPQRKMTQINNNIYELNAHVEVELNEVQKTNLRQCGMEAPKPWTRRRGGLLLLEFEEWETK